MKTLQLLTFAMLLACFVGCEAPATPTANDSAPEEKETVAKEEVKEEKENVAPSEPREVTGRDPKKGKRSREKGGRLGQILGAGMYAQHQAVFLNVKRAINIDYGLNGSYPKSHEEFMRRVIEFNNIQLPELDEGDEYLYDPEDHTLKIYRPGN